NTGVSPKEEKESSLSRILQERVPRRYYLTKTACLGILRRARERGKELPSQLKAALEIQSGLRTATEPHTVLPEVEAYHINQRNEGIDLGGVSGALMATQNIQMQTFVTGAPVAFAANQRDEVRDLHDVAGALGAQPGMKQQTFIAEGCLTPWDTQQARVFTPDSTAPTLTGADGGGGRNPAGILFAAGVVSKGNGDCFLMPENHTSLTKGGGQAGQGYPCVMTAGFCAGAGPSAGGIGYTEEISPTLKATESGTNMVPSILCLNDQGGRQMSCTEDMTGTLRAQEHGHQPLVFENHGIDSRYTGPHEVAPTMSARYGTGGNNVPLVSQEPDAICIAGNTIDRQPKNGGNGLGCQEDIAYTLTATDHHAVFSRQRVDVFRDDDVASTQSARQHKDATDLVCQPTYQETVGTIGYTDHKGVNNQFVSEDKCIVEGAYLIRRLTPLECERLQGFPDFWTDISGASDSARYKALGNSVAIPCVEYIMHGLALVLNGAA
ncbi:MAG TPA: hypothetical protein DD735_01840, partial [Clostridiales bacterium]|nr:hypothetical protein [Clostridiales bacterium]